MKHMLGKNGKEASEIENKNRWPFWSTENSVKQKNNKKECYKIYKKECYKAFKKKRT